MLEELLKTDFFAYINEHRPGNLPEWAQEPIVQEELIDDAVFDIVDMRGHAGSIKREQGQGETTYFNGDGTYRYALRFVRFEEFVSQFRTFRENGQTENDWTRGMSRPDYMVYNIREKTEVCLLFTSFPVVTLEASTQTAGNSYLTLSLLYQKFPVLGTT